MTATVFHVGIVFPYAKTSSKHGWRNDCVSQSSEGCSVCDREEEQKGPEKVKVNVYQRLQQETECGGNFDEMIWGNRHCGTMEAHFRCWPVLDESKSSAKYTSFQRYTGHRQKIEMWETFSNRVTQFKWVSFNKRFLNASEQKDRMLRNAQQTSIKAGNFGTSSHQKALNIAFPILFRIIPNLFGAQIWLVYWDLVYIGLKRDPPQVSRYGCM